MNECTGELLVFLHALQREFLHSAFGTAGRKFLAGLASAMNRPPAFSRSHTEGSSVGCFHFPCESVLALLRLTLFNAQALGRVWDCVWG